MLKCDLHLHTCDGVREKYIGYDALKLIDTAAELGFDVLSITNHDTITYNNYINDYARERGILLIPGVEITHQGKHILAYNITKQYDGIRDVADIEKIRDKNNLFIAPHPFFPAGNALGSKFIKWRHIFDAVEYSHFYTENINFNTRAVQKAEEYDLPMVGTSDSHMLRQLNSTYTFINAEKNSESVFAAVKRGDVRIVTSPLSVPELGYIAYELLLRHSLHKIGTACFCFLSVLWRGMN